MDKFVKLPKLTIINQYMNNTRVARMIFSPQNKNDKSCQLMIEVENQILSTVDLWINDNVSLSEPLSPLDLAVLDAVYTIMKAGQMIMTIEWILLVLTGNANIRLTPKRQKLIEDSLKKMNGIVVRITLSNSSRMAKHLKQLTYEGYLLPTDKIRGVYASNGKSVEVYRVLREPILYTFAEDYNRELICIPAQVFGLSSSQAKNETINAILIKRYVLKRVYQIKHNNKLNSNKISLEWRHGKKVGGLYHDLGYEPDGSEMWRKKTKPMITRIVRATLDFLKENNVIADYQPYFLDGTNKVNGYTIHANSHVKSGDKPCKKW